MNAKFVVVLLVFSFVVLLGVSIQDDASASGGCDIQEFTMTPVDPYTLGTWVRLEGWSNCGQVMFTIANPSTGGYWEKAEIGSGHQFENWKTEETGTGTFEVCFVAKGNDSSWPDANRRCRTVYVEGGQPPLEGEGSVCQVLNFNITRSGKVYNFASQGQCTGNLRAGRYLINGNPWGDHSTPVYHATWDASGVAPGSYQICYQVTGGDWEDADASCQDITVQADPPAEPEVIVVQPMIDNPQPDPQPNPQPDPVPVIIDPAPAPACGNAQSPLFNRGDSGIVAYGDGTGSHIQGAPAEKPDLLYLNEGDAFEVVGGPSCAINLRWWQVSAQGVTGWIAEGDQYGYWLSRTSSGPAPVTPNPRPVPPAPVNIVPTGGDCGFGTAVLDSGDTGEVTYTGSEGLNVRAAPGTASDPKIASMFQGDTFTVLSGTSCGEGYRWIHLRTSRGTEGWMVERDSEDVYVARTSEFVPEVVATPVPDPEPPAQTIRTLSYFYPPFNETYTFVVDVSDANGCVILNGSEIVAQEINRSFDWAIEVYSEEKWGDADMSVIRYLKNDGDLDTFRIMIDAYLVREARCLHSYYQIGSATMDQNGLGNILFGYYSLLLPKMIDHWIGHADQLWEDHRFDFPDDRSQMDLGRGIALSGEPVTPGLIESLIPSGFTSST
jgi:hypothetical protein